MVFKRLIIFFSLITSCINIFGQLTINASLTPTQLVQNILIQGGLSISNVTFTGATGSTTSQIGSFTNASTTYLGLTSGIVLSSGYVTDIPSAGNANGNMSDATGTPGDIDLDSLTGGSAGTYDASVLQFDFIPTTNTVSFTYVFGSEEYPDFVCSEFNDVFGFFLSGPGISGPYSNNSINIALIPGSSPPLPVAINTVNIGTAGSSGTTGGCISLAYSSLYVDNTSDPSIVFGGMTKVLTATHSVTPCQMYHIKIAVCDVGDEVYDSSVLLGANSFNAGGVNVSSNYSNAAVGNNAIKGCSNGIFLFSSPAPVSSPLTINYLISGTATNGVDYFTIPNSVTIQTGYDTASVTIQPLLNGFSGTVIIGTLSTCDTIYDTINIVPYIPMTPLTSGNTSICLGGSVTIGVTNSGGVNPYSYNWSNSLGTDSTYNVLPTNTTTYSVTVTDKCNQTAIDSVTVSVTSTLTPVITGPTSICTGTTGTLDAGAGYSTYLWSTAANTETITVNTRGHIM